MNEKTASLKSKIQDTMSWKALALSALMVGILPYSAQAETKDTLFAKVQSLNLNVRAAPGGAGEVVSVFSEGTELVITEQEGPWFQVRSLAHDDAAEGWVHGNYIRLIVAPDRSISPAPEPQMVTASKLQASPIAIEPKKPKPMPDLGSPIEVEATGFECAESRAREGYDHCKVDAEVSVALPAAFVPYAAETVDIYCESTVEYQAQGGDLDTTNITSDTITLPLTSTRSSTALELEHALYALVDPAVSIRLMDVSCEPAY